MGYLRKLYHTKILSLLQFFGGDCLNDLVNMNFSTIYHPQLDGKTKRVNRMIEHMWRMYVLDKLSKWEYYLHLVEFSYNNGYQASLKMNPFEAF
jgi:hypothetical protein